MPGPITGKTMVRLIDKQDPVVSFAPFDVERFLSVTRET